MVHVLLYLSRIEILHVSVWHNAAGPQNNVPSESSFATKGALDTLQNPYFEYLVYHFKFMLFLNIHVMMYIIIFGDILYFPFALL